MADPRKYPYSNMGSMNIFISLACGNSEMLYAPPMPIYSCNSKIVTPSSPLTQFEKFKPF